MSIRRGGIATGLVYVALTVALLGMLAFLLHFDRARFDSDNAAASMLAEAMRLRGSLLPSGWTYNNGDLMLPSGALVIALLIGVLPNGFLAHAIFAVCALLMMLGAVWRLVTMLGWHRIVGLFVGVIFAAGISHGFTEMLYAQSTYVWWPAGFLFGASIILRYRRSASERRHAWLIVAMFALVATISFANPGRVLLMMVAPLYVFDARLRADCAEKARARRSAVGNALDRVGLFDPMTLIGMGAAFVVSAAVYFYLQSNGRIPSAYGAAGLHWGGWAGVARHLRTFVEGWPAYLGVTPRSQASGLSLDGLAAAATWVVPVALILVAVDSLRHLRRPAQPVRRAFCWAFLAAFVPIFSMYLAFDPLAIDSTTVRYFTLPICILVILFGFTLDSWVRAWPRPAPGAIAIVAIAMMLAGIGRLVPFATHGHGWLPTASKSPAERLGDALLREDLRWGYATWWNAGATTVLSDSRVRVSPVQLTNGIAPFYTMVLRDWYLPATWQGPTFLALSLKELTPRILLPVEGVLGKPERTIDTGEYRVLVYDYNIASRFGCISDDRLDTAFTRSNHPVRITAVSWNEAVKDRSALVVHVHNDGARTVTSAGRYPLMIGVQLLDGSGRVVAPDFVHAPLPCPIAPGAEATVTVWLPTPGQDATTLRVDLVQERVAWFRDWGEKTWELPLAEKTTSAAAISH